MSGPRAALAVAFLVAVVQGLVVTAGPWKPGGEPEYDGVFYDLIARDPIGYADRAYRADSPVLRYQRIVYPIVARGLALGNEEYIGWTLFLVTFVSVVLGVYVLARLLDGWGVSPWYALVYGLFIGQFVSIRFTTSEPLCVLFVLLGVWAIRHSRWWIGSGCFGLALLTKELAFPFWLGYLIDRLARRKWRESAILAGAGLPFVGWVVVLRLWLGTFAIEERAGFSRIPFGGYVGQGPSPETALVPLLLLLPAIVTAGLAIWQWRIGGGSALAFGLLLNALMVVHFSDDVTGEMRGLGWLSLGFVAAVVLFGAERRLRRVLNYSLLWIPLSFLYVAGMFAFGVSRSV